MLVAVLAMGLVYRLQARHLHYEIRPGEKLREDQAVAGRSQK